MKIAIGKIGQKIIFDNKLSSNARSNINGNIVVSKFYQLLFEKIPEHDWYIVGDSDYIPLIPNVYYGTPNDKYDLGIFFSGVIFEDSDPCLQCINNTNIKWYLISEDPFCLPKTTKLKREPDKIFGMGYGKESLLKNTYNIIPFNIGSCIAYKHANSIYDDKDIECVLSIGDSNKDGRYTTMASYIALPECNNIQIYGRENVVLNGRDNRYKGEVTYNEMIEIYKRSSMCICTPTKINWYTGKIIECLMYDMAPILTKEYDYSALLPKNIRWDGYNDEHRLFYKIETVKDYGIYKKILTYKEHRHSYIENIKEVLGYDYWVDGSYISDFVRENVIHELR